MEPRTQFAPVVVALGDPLAMVAVEGSLEAAGYPVVRAPDGEHALVAVDEARPRVLIVELGEDAEDREVLRALAASATRDHLRVLGLATGGAERAAGVDDVLHRPFAARELVRRVDRLYSQVDRG